MDIRINFNQLYAEIGYSFKDETILKQAMTHRSYGGKHYERLEFLGDSILGFVIADKLYHKFPHYPEGILSQLRMSLVKGKTLTQLAQKLNIGDYLILGPGEISAGGHKKKRILEDAMEALIGAIYLDSDTDTVKKCILTWLDEKINMLTLEEDTKDDKSRLQERLLQNGFELPVYKLIGIEGQTHEQQFVIELNLIPLNTIITTKNRTRKSAEQNAASQANLLLDKEDTCHGTQKKWT